MTLVAGTRLGPYEIRSTIGAGGMGEVYRARDTKLDRDVAIKVLPESFATDPERLARFEREAKTLASLNHPHIAAIYGLEESPSAGSGQAAVRALVMELVEGEDLSQRIVRGPIPLEDALPIARQIAEALEAAHEQGIIHRDLKPANIKVRADGTVKVLDFGLAKALDPVGQDFSPAGVARSKDPAYTNSPTITSPAVMTGVGMILGTAAYMAPEQARGRVVDRRADIWAFGCVVYEMLTGKRAFEGEDVSITLASVLKSDPDWSALPSSTTPGLRRLLARCLKKDPKERLQAIGDARIEIAELLSAPAEGATAVVTMVRPVPLWRRSVIPAGAVLAAAIVAGAAVWFVTRPTATPPQTSRFAIVPSPAQSLYIATNSSPDVAISADGSHIVWIGGANGTDLMVRAIDRLEATAVRGITAPRSPFMSPDGRWIGFADLNNALKKIAVTGGPAVDICQVNTFVEGASWGPDGTIVFATSDLATGLLSVPASGGEPKTLTTPDRAQGEQDHRFPSVLPGGQAVLFTILGIGAAENNQVAVLDLKTGQRKTLIRGGSQAEYLPTGHLIYAVAGTLRAVRLDLARLEVLGDAVPVVDQVMTKSSGAAVFAVSQDGALVYSTEGEFAARTLVWVDRRGQETAIAAAPRRYAYPRLSPDGARLAVSVVDQQLDIWLWDLARPTLTRTTFDPANDSSPVWTPDGRRLVFSSERAGSRNLFVQAADGTGAIERLTESPDQQNANSVSPDGKRLVFTDVGTTTRDDLMQVEVDGTHAVTPLVKTPFVERNGEVSPDGRWLAYEANDSQQLEIYVRPFPDVNSGHWQVSTNGGERPLWARNSQELFYMTAAGALMRVGVDRGPTWRATAPTKLIEGPNYYSPAGTSTGRTYDVSSDSQRFLMIKQAASDQTSGPPSLVVVQNWFEELKRLLPSK